MEQRQRRAHRIVPIAAISEWYKYNFVKGVQINPQGWAFNTYYVAYEQVPVNLRGFVPPNPNNVLGWRPPPQEDVSKWPGDIVTYSSRVCPSQGGGSGMFRGPSIVDVQRARVLTAPTGTTDPYWEDRNFTKYLDKVRENVSVFVVHGLVDYNVKTHNLMPWLPALQAHGIPTKILVGQWPHSAPYSFSNRNSLLEWNVTLLRWFDYWLKGVETGIMDEPRADIQDYRGVWRREDNYPPSRVVDTKFFFTGDGKLKSEGPGTGQASFWDNQQGPQLNGGPISGAPKNFASFVSQPLEQEFRYSGEAVAHVELTHSTPIGHIAVTVYEVDGQTWRPVNWGFYGYNIRNTPEKFDPILPNEKIVLNVPLLPTDMVIPAGRQVAVVFSAQNSGGPGMLPVPSGGTSTVDLAKSHITFPMLDGIEPLAPQPLNLRGQPATYGSQGN
ncbi:MAG: prolyl oligopeptidase family serine peptidase [Euryarchaeota archaeon]|nr:prolyl oligopeptidase family serine peptidase [Euryarchaeota archaeon]